MFDSLSVESNGKCLYCSQEIPGNNVLDHFDNCRLYQNAVFQAGRKKPESMDNILVLQVFDNRNPDYWLVLEINAKRRLIELDYYLKKIWYECCDSHRSWFHRQEDGVSLFYLSQNFATAFSRRKEVFYSYDKDNTSTARIIRLRSRRGNQTGHYPVLLLARNNPFNLQCTSCDEKSEWLVMDGEDQHKAVCDHHKDSLDSPEKLVKIYNSPRTGFCTYDGPATVPY